MRKHTVGLAIMAFAALAACEDRNAAATDEDRSAAINVLAKSVIASRGVPGIAIAVVRDGKVIQKVTQGYSDIAGGKAVSSTTPFQLASTTKIFSSIAVLTLVEDGKIGLDAPIGDYLNDLPAAWRGVTVRQLLSHTSGLPDITRASGELDLVANDWQRALPIVAKAPFQFQPGQSWAYTQTNYAILQRLVEKTSGKPFEDYLQDHLFRPLGMSNTFFPNADRQCAVNYVTTPKGAISKRDLSFPPYVHAAGGLCSSLDDLIRWSRALDSGKVIPNRLVEQAWAPTKLDDGSNAKVSSTMSYGLGWAVDTTPNYRWVGHSGGNSTAFRRYIDSNLTVIVLHNGASDPDAIASAVARDMLQRTLGQDAQANLWDAADDGDVAAVEAAVQAGANVNALDTRTSRNGRYALNWAAVKDHPEIIRFLLQKGAVINAQNLTGFTALHHAAEVNSRAAAEALLQAGADTNLRNAQGETAADVARRKGNADLAVLIERPRKTK
jgi:CubicO group peptidase (beta-lactamase class C family)